MSTQQIAGMTEYQNRNQLLSDQDGVKLIKIPFGTFAGVQERLFVIEKNGMVAFDTGDQGGGQN
ncbi:MAG: hypothetical protein JO151_13775 [Verrucomicrobia bacterium]|nr:hypothetical protein [Verrucomicrobiota bacterium]